MGAGAGEAQREGRVSALEDTLAFQIKAAKLPKPEREFRFHPTRRWRFDFCWPQRRVALEVEGGIWTRGRHSRGGGMKADAEKYNEAALLGWTVIRVCGDHVRSGEALAWIERALARVAA